MKIMPTNIQKKTLKKTQMMTPNLEHSVGPSRFKAIWLAMILAGCASESLIPAKLDIPARSQQQTETTAIATGNNLSASTVSDAKNSATIVADNPRPPALPVKPAQEMVPIVSGQAADVTLNFDSLPLPAFIQTVYATVLKRNISIDPAVMARKDLVTLRSGKALTAVDAENSARLLLKSYGIAVQDIGGLIRIVPDNNATGYLPEIRRGRAMPDSPLPLRPVFQLVELQVVRNTEIVSYVKTLFGDKVRVTEDPIRNSLLLAGNGDDVQASLEAIQMLDQPLFKGRNSIRITPLIWSAEELTKRLTEILIQEGYSIGTTTNVGSIQFPITLLPVSGLNSIIVFAQSIETLNHITEWAQVLDKPAEKSVGKTFFSYQVKNTDASRLAETVQKLLGSTPASAKSPATTTTTGASANVGGANSVVVDKATNTILFRATGEDYTDIVRLLRDLDRTSRQVLIEVTVLEVTLDDTVKTGVDWIFSNLNSSGRSVVASGGNTSGTIAGNVLSSVAGLVVSQLDGASNPRAVLTALATDTRVTLLSNPKLLARNGESASIQVGDSIPILNQQQTTSTSGTGVISSVQYVETGTILKIKPVIHSSDQVDMDITQEISSPGTVASGGIGSPPIGKRIVDTKLTLKHGATYVLGGLISNRKETTTTGVPFLKDIPIFGRAFKSNTDVNKRSEIIVMITPYIMNDDADARVVTEAVRKQLGSWAQEQPGATKVSTTPMATPTPQ